MKKWSNKKMCMKCRRFKTWGGVKLLFGLIKIKKWEHNYCACKSLTYEELKKIYKEIGEADRKAKDDMCFNAFKNSFK